MTTFALKLLDTYLIDVYYIFMIQIFQKNSVSKNNFLSLMKSYEVNYQDFIKLVDIKIINHKNLNKKYVSMPSRSKKKLSLSIQSVSNHTAIVRFSYTFFSSEQSLNYVDLKIYFDSKQVEIISSSKSRAYKIHKDLKSYHNQRLSRWYKNYFVSHWISSCLQDGYSFNACSEV